MLKNTFSQLTPYDQALLKGEPPGWVAGQMEIISQRNKLIEELQAILPSDRIAEFQNAYPCYALGQLQLWKIREDLVTTLLNTGVLEDNSAGEYRDAASSLYSQIVQLRCLVNQEMFDGMQGLLRPNSTQIPEILVPRDTSDLTEFITASLHERGLYRERLKFRYADRSRLQTVRATGSDRDYSSKTDHHHGGQDGEHRAMFENGLHPQYDQGLVTYQDFLHSFYTGASVQKFMEQKVILIYAPEATTPIGGQSNGFHMFVDQRVIRRSCVTIFI